MVRVEIDGVPVTATGNTARLIRWLMRFSRQINDGLMEPFRVRFKNGTILVLIEREETI